MLKLILDPVALAWSSWISLAVGVISILITVLGLAFTFREARRARTAAQTAADAVARVVALTRSRSRLSALSSAVAQADSISLRISHGTLSREHFTGFRRAVMETLVVASSPINPEKLTEVTTSLEELASLIGYRVDWAVKQDQMQTVMDALTNFLVAEEALARTEALS